MHKKLENIKEAIRETDKLSDEKKQISIEKIEEWILYDEPFGLLKNILMEIDEHFFDEIFAEFGLIEVI